MKQLGLPEEQSPIGGPWRSVDSALEGDGRWVLGLGHSSIVMTLDTYAHVLPTMQQDASKRLDSILFE